MVVYFHIEVKGQTQTPGRNQSDDLRSGLNALKWPFLKTMSDERGKINSQAAKYRTGKDASGTFNQNLYFSSVSGASYFKKAMEEGSAGG